ESQVESCEHQDNANIHHQPFPEPESVSEEHEIYTDYNGCHRHHVKHDSYLSDHFSTSGAPDISGLAIPQPSRPPRVCVRDSLAVDKTMANHPSSIRSRPHVSSHPPPTNGCLVDQAILRKTLTENIPSAEPVSQAPCGTSHVGNSKPPRGR